MNRSYKDSSGATQESVSYLDCSAWGRQGEIINQYLHKGDAILLSGRLDQRSWEDKTTGQKRSRVEIVVEDFNFINGGNGGNGGGSYGSNNSGASNAAKSGGDVAPDDVPAEEEAIDLEGIPF